MIVGEFDIAELIKAKPIDLWSITKHGSGITRRYFDAYFLGSSVGYALRIGAVRPFTRHIHPYDVISDFTPPQSYRYLYNDIC
jgi:predicted transcriptional regulator